jgi:hypothetical protein
MTLLSNSLMLLEILRRKERVTRAQSPKTGGGKRRYNVMLKA